MPAFDHTPTLLVEDSDDDLFFFRRLFAKAGFTAPFAVATNGQNAIRHLEAALNGSEPNKPVVPRLVFLDLKLPLRNGFEVLQWIRARPSLAQVIVVVLSSSAEARDVAEAFALGAQGYVVKYPSPALFSEILRVVVDLPPDADLTKLTLPGLARPNS
jgi:CheY-like chemotaxis protein